PLPAACVDEVGRLAADPPADLTGLLDDEEIEALATRAASIVRHPVFPYLRSARAYPWPLV
ncbi:MAG TPA: phosphatidylinositol kinase, partial [Acidimicrobiales bacterium]|nr:phosphatidylinositol kinase [Acidimicrobiales bacterium]